MSENTVQVAPQASNLAVVPNPGSKSRPRNPTKPVSTPKKVAVPKTTVTKSKQSKKSSTPSHPKFIEMISEAIESQKERTGSSRQAILKYIVTNYPVDQKTANQHVKVALKNGVKTGQLKQAKGVGASGSFKLGESSKSVRSSRPAVITVVAAKPVAKKAAQKPKLVVKAAKPVLKKSTPVITEARKPKQKTVTKEAAKAKLPSAPVKTRGASTPRGEVVPKKKQEVKHNVVAVSKLLPVKIEKEDKKAVSVKQAAASKTKKTANRKKKVGSESS